MSGASSVRGGFDSHAFPPFLCLAFAALIATGLTAWPDPAGAQAVSDTVRAPASPRSTAKPIPPARQAVPDTSRSRAPAVVDTLRVPETTSTLADVDSIGEPPGADTLRIARAALRRKPPSEPKGFDRPRWVMVRSLLLPGWGQAYNKSWWKAVGIGGTELALIGKIVDDKLKLDGIQRDIDDARAIGNIALEQEQIDRYNAQSDKFVGHQWWLGALLAYSMLDAYIDAHFRNFRIDLEDDPMLPSGDREEAGTLRHERGPSFRMYWQETF